MRDWPESLAIGRELLKSWGEEIMKQLIQLLFLVVSLGVACQPAETPTQETEQPPTKAEEPDRGTAEATIGGAQLSVDYGRPELLGRDMLGKLEDGQVWRLGMNEATVFESDQDLTFGDTVIKAGSYSLWARKVSSEEWHLIFNSEAEIWGTQRKPENDVAEVPAERTELSESVEKFVIELVPTGDQSGEIVMKWATLQLRVPFSIVSMREGSG